LSWVATGRCYGRYTAAWSIRCRSTACTGGSVGFLMNEYPADDLLDRLDRAEAVELRPLRIVARTIGSTDTITSADLSLRKDGVNA